MMHSIATVSISGNLEEKIAAIATAGFKGVEIFENDLLAFPGSVADIAAMIADAGLVCTAYQPFRDFEGMPPELRERIFDRAERKFDLMQTLGAPVMLVCSNVSPQSLPDRGRIADDFRELGARAHKRGLVVGYEALAWGRHVNDHRDAWAIVRAVDHPAIGLILDSFHSFARNIPIESIAGIDPAKIVLVQVADAPRLKMDELYWSRHFRNMPGQGDLPVVDYVAALEAIGYRGPLSLEIFNDRFRAGSAGQVALDGRRSLILIDDALARRRGQASAPPRIQCSGVEFLEFACSAAEAGGLSQMLSSLGFHRSGRHHRKAVTRWSQGEINIVVNEETEGFAHAHAVSHGCSVCAVGLRVPSAAAAMRRANLFEVTSFHQEVAPEEYKIPAIRSVGGSLIYFMEEGLRETVWAAEFSPVTPTGKGFGLTRVDHVAQSLGYEEMLSWLLYYYSLFDVEKTPQLEINDPLGVVLSQAVESPDGALRITMNGSSARQTLASRFLQSYFGAGIQHIAFETADIWKTASALEASGALMLDIPQNYYDDLGARFGLDADLIDRMRRHHVLYDRSGDGEYFQIYTRAYAKRFFFEIVQRSGYTGYGAANAPIRLAAQSRFKADAPI
ncbi:MAG: TIM barrel protein [Hyphomonadaceae bacterium]|nr:TIM barrel protein [Hyphomonadaceae bacterium]